MLAQPKNVEIETTKERHTFVCRNMDKKKGLIMWLVIGFFWFCLTQLLMPLTFDILKITLLLSNLAPLYFCLFLIFGKTTIEIGADKISVHKMQIPFPTKKVFALKDVKEIFFDTNLMKDGLDINAELKSGKKIKLFSTNKWDDANILTQMLCFSVEKFHPENKSKVTSLINNKTI